MKGLNGSLEEGEGTSHYKGNLLFSLTVLLDLAEISRTFSTCGHNHLGNSSKDIYKDIRVHNLE